MNDCSSSLISFFSSFTFRFFTSKCFRGTYFRQACVTHVGQLRSNDEVQATHLALIRKIIVNLISQITRRDHCVRRYSFAIKASFTSQIHVFPLRFPLMVFTPSLFLHLSRIYSLFLTLCLIAILVDSIELQRVDFFTFDHAR